MVRAGTRLGYWCCALLGLLLALAAAGTAQAAGVVPQAPMITPGRPAPGAAVRVAGSLGPGAGRASRAVQVQRYAGHGAWRTVARGRTDARARYAVAVRVPRVSEGSYAFRVHAAAAPRSRAHRALPAVASAYRVVHLADTSAPAVPVGLTATPGDGQVVLSWRAVTSRDLAGYRVYRAAGGSGSWTLLGTTTAGSTTRVVTGLAADVTGYYAVTSRDRAGNESARSAVVAARPSVPVVAPAPAPAAPDTSCGSLVVDEVWTASRVHEVRCDLVVPAGRSLTLRAGTVVEVADGAAIVVHGTLTAEGTEQHPVELSALSAAPAPGQWAGVDVSGGHARLDGVALRYARAAVTSRDGAEVEVHGSITRSLVGVSSEDDYVDATDVDWGDPSGPGPWGSGSAVHGAGVDFVPYDGWTPAVVPPRSGSVTPPDGACSSLVFLGVRGSGEAPTDSGEDAAYADGAAGLGQEIGAVHDGFAAELARSTSLDERAIGLRYRATPVPGVESGGIFHAVTDAAWTASLWQGVDRLEDYLDEEVARCGDSQRYVLAGYSQGALVVHAYLAERSTPAVRRRIAAVGLVADPAADAHDAVTAFTDDLAPQADRARTTGLLRQDALVSSAVHGADRLPGDAVGRTASVCNAHDIVCAPGAGATVDAHDGYATQPGELAALGAWLVHTAAAAGSGS